LSSMATTLTAPLSNTLLIAIGMAFRQTRAPRAKKGATCDRDADGVDRDAMR
jgi:hypothetical protein